MNLSDFSLVMVDRAVSPKLYWAMEYARKLQSAGVVGNAGAPCAIIDHRDIVSTYVGGSEHQLERAVAAAKGKVIIMDITGMSEHHPLSPYDPYTEKKPDCFLASRLSKVMEEGGCVVLIGDHDRVTQFLDDNKGLASRLYDPSRYMNCAAEPAKKVEDFLDRVRDNGLQKQQSLNKPGQKLPQPKR